MNPVNYQSALHPAGPQASQIADLWWLMFWVCAAVFVLVLAAALAALVRARGRNGTPTSERALARGVGIATGATIVTLIVLLFASVGTGRALASLRSGTPLDVEVTAAQWWWRVEYAAPEASGRVATANEIHLPAGRIARVSLKSNDVIHSFWIPNLAGKIDLIPGRGNVIWLQADTPGMYRGQCAEFCGVQHANMALVVTVEPEAQFQAWLASQRADAPEPQSAAEVHGRQLFERGTCALCHAVQGTTAGARFGPDLTHLASRATLAGGELPNTAPYLSQWLADPQRIKPGSRMPATGLSGQNLQDLVAYLERLK
jgi:cytochrome c oxidase subunit 2